MIVNAGRGVGVLKVVAIWCDGVTRTWRHKLRKALMTDAIGGYRLPACLWSSCGPGALLSVDALGDGVKSSVAHVITG